MHIIITVIPILCAQTSNNPMVFSGSTLDSHCHKAEIPLYLRNDCKYERIGQCSDSLCKGV